MAVGSCLPWASCSTALEKEGHHKPPRHFLDNKVIIKSDMHDFLNSFPSHGGIFGKYKVVYR